MDLKNRLENVNNRINKAALKCGRDPENIHLVAVSKTIPANRVKEAIELGVTILGENYVQEARDKFNVLGTYPVSWHFIGHLQTNKAKYAVRLFDLIHSVDTLKLARELDKQAKKVNKVQDILIQINVSKEPSKSGSDIESAGNLIKDIVHLENLSLKGFMAMPPFFNNPEKARPYFIALRNLRDQVQKTLPGVALNELSMGMTGDFEVAIEEGATFVRIGTAIFGERR
ncbi:MAG TPA: YggS family pyridoxal phosphate-dependent enzyme [Desulfobacterales bacterium]|nr:YggS family pyridoxal phosphate-dependent enzyme [Desulfobacterales bacterium]